MKNKKDIYLYRENRYLLLFLKTNYNHLVHK